MEIFRKVILFFQKFYYDILAWTSVYHGFLTMGSNNGVCTSTQCEKAASMITSNMNPNTDRCVNFYDYACGNFKIHHPIPPDEQVITYQKIRIKEIKGRVEDFYKNTDLKPYPNIRKIYEIYQQCLHQESYNIVPLKTELNMAGLPETPPFHIDIEDSFDIVKALAKVHRYSPSKFLFAVSVDMDPRETTTHRILFNRAAKATSALVKNEDDYNEFEATKAEIRSSTIKYIARTLNHLYKELNVSFTPEQKEMLKNRIEDVADFLLELDQVTIIDKYRNPLEISYADRETLQNWTNNHLKNGMIQIDWKHYFEVLFEDTAVLRMNLEKEKILIESADQQKYLLRLLQKTSRNVFVCAMWFNVVDSINYCTPPILQQIREEYRAEVLKIAIPRAEKKELMCFSLFTSYFNAIVGYILTKEENGMKKRAQVTRMVHNIKRSFREIIQETSWLDKQTKAEAIKKLKSITSTIGFEDYHLDLRVIEAAFMQISKGSNFYETYSILTRKIRHGMLTRLLERVSFKKKYGLNTTSFASYNGHFMHFTIGIGSLEFPYYNQGLQALQYAIMGFHIGHELGHAFDMEGRFYKGKGEFKCWWSDESMLEYDKRAICFRNFYDKFYYENIKKKVDGQLTLEENMADSMGFAVALRTYQKYYKGKEKKLRGLEEFTDEQLFTLAYANAFCENSTPFQQIIVIEKDTHAPSQDRVNGILMNSKEFERIWNCALGTPMNPTQKCEIFS